MPSSQPWKNEGMNKPEWVAKEVAKAVKAGKEWELETVDFSDPNRPLTCLEVDFPIIPINQIAAIEGNAGKPIYQMSKWWARRRSSVFRSLLLAAATKAPEDPSEAAKLVWEAYYGNHQAKGSFKHLKVADVFMGGGTTVVEGSRLGMQMYGNDLNPIAWFVTKNELAMVSKAEVEALFAEIDSDVRPQVSPLYTCDCPRGHKGVWTNVSSGKEMPSEFAPLAVAPELRQEYRYEGPEIISAFWAKHGPCQVTGCGHRTPIMTTPVISMKSFSVRYWPHRCTHCASQFHLEEREARMAPGAPMVVSPSEELFAVLKGAGVVCPSCGCRDENVSEVLRLKAKKKKVKLTLFIHPDWLSGEGPHDKNGNPFGGTVDDSLQATNQWIEARTKNCRFVEVRGIPSDRVVCPETGKPFWTDTRGGTVPGKSAFNCASCGTKQDILKSVGHSGKSAPFSMYAIQGYCPQCESEKQLYGGRFFAPISDPSPYSQAVADWNSRKDGDLNNYYPKTLVPEGFKTTYQRIPEHGYPSFAHMFNPRQLLVHSLLLRSLSRASKRYSDEAVSFVLGGFQQYLRNQNMFCLWNPQRDTLEPHFSTNNYYPKNTAVENCVFPSLGRGNWTSCKESLISALDWKTDPWDLVANAHLSRIDSASAEYATGKSSKVFPNDPPNSPVSLHCSSSNQLSFLGDHSIDIVITDPPFGNNVQYAELADFFHVWLRNMPAYQRSGIKTETTPKAVEAVVNPVRNPDDPHGFYKKMLTSVWAESYRVLKQSGIVAFTFHHSEDRPWVAVLESLFDAGFYLEATYPIRSDETKGEGAKPGTFGSQLIEYDIIHVCRKRSGVQKSISWAKLRRQILGDVSRLKELLEHHQSDGLPEADMQVIRRGKALEYYSRHYGKVYKDPDTPLTVLEAIVGINQLLEEEAGGEKEAPPHNAEPFTRLLLRLFDGIQALPRDQMYKFLRGTGSAPSDYTARGWTSEKNKIFRQTPPLEIARNWAGKLRKGMTSDYDQAMFLIGACIEGSGINANETLNNDNFLPHPALGSIVTWFKTHGADSSTRNAASRAQQLYQIWESKNQKKVSQLSLFESLGEEGA